MRLLGTYSLYFMICMVGFFCLGCNVDGTVTDQSKTETTVTQMSLCGDQTLSVFHGGNMKEIPLDAITSVSVFNEDAKTIKGKLYFCASLEFRDGSKLDARTKSNGPLTYICVMGSLCGETEKGRFSINLANVNKVSIIYK